MWDNLLTKMEQDITVKRPKFYKLLKHMTKDTKENANLDIKSSKTWLDFFQKL